MTRTASAETFGCSMSRRRYRALGWVGGKSAHSAARTGTWIAGLLPPPGVTYTYCEPFAGMLGVLLQRQEAARPHRGAVDEL